MRTILLLVALAVLGRAQILSSILADSSSVAPPITVLDSTHGTNGGFITAAPSGSANALATAAILAATIVSTTSQTPGMGAFTFTTSAALGASSPQRVYILSRGTPTAFLAGTVTTDVATALVINADTFGGTGAHTDWNIYLAPQCAGASFIGLGTLAYAGVSTALLTVADTTGSNTYSFQTNYAGGGGPNVGFWFVGGPTAANDLVTTALCSNVSCGAQGNTMGLQICLAGTATTTPLRDHQGFGSVGATNFPIPALATAATDLVFTGFFEEDNQCAGITYPPAGYTPAGTAQRGGGQAWFAYKLGSVSNPENINWGTCGVSGHGAAFAVSIKQLGT